MVNNQLFFVVFFSIITYMRTRAIIHLERFLSNFHAVSSRIGQKRICVPVKADAYGHGAIEIAKASINAGAFCLGVATAGEGTELRREGIKAPILLLSQTHIREIPVVIDANLTPLVSDSLYADALNEKAAAAKIRLPVHIKIDTGMGRIGCSVEEAPNLARHIAECPWLELAGTATHFAVSDSQETLDITYTQTQISRFKEAVEAIRAAGIDPGIVHAANSGAVILHPDSWFDMVRPGILLYGYKTTDESKIPGFPYEPLEVTPVMELQSTVVLIKKIKKGESISYGRTWVAGQDTNIAILPVGYADGFPRLVSGKWQVVIRGKVYPQVGRISMDQCCVDIGPQSDVRRWDEAVIFGGNLQKTQQGMKDEGSPLEPQPSLKGEGSPHNAAGLAIIAGTIPYEITCNISARIPRVYKT